MAVASDANRGVMHRDVVEDLERTIIEELPEPWGIFLLQCHNEACLMFEACQELNVAIEPVIPEMKDSGLPSISYRVLNSHQGRMSEGDLDAISLMMVGYCFTVVAERCPPIAEDPKYDEMLPCCPGFHRDDITVIRNVRHAFEHADVYLGEDGTVLLRNDLKGIETRVGLHRFVEESIPCLERIVGDPRCDAAIRDIIRDTLTDLKRISDGGVPRTIKPLMIAMMMFCISLDETFGRVMHGLCGPLFQRGESWAKRLREKVRGLKYERGRDGYELGSVIEYMELYIGYDARKLRDSFAHADIKFHRLELTAYDRSHNPIGVLNMEELVELMNDMQMMYEMPVQTLCLAVLVCCSDEYRAGSDVDLTGRTTIPWNMEWNINRGRGERLRSPDGPIVRSQLLRPYRNRISTMHGHDRRSRRKNGREDD